MFAIPPVSVVEHKVDLPLPSDRSSGSARIGARRAFFDAEERDDTRPLTTDLYWIQLANHDCRNDVD
jgi:hypothetical protein